MIQLWASTDHQVQELDINVSTAKDVLAVAWTGIEMLLRARKVIYNADLGAGATVTREKALVASQANVFTE